MGPDPDLEQQLITDELLIIRHSGEIPEVALHGSIFFLTSDPDGPALSLGDRELSLMKKMVVERYREIIGRDLDPDNRHRSIYRGLARCIVNWQRMTRFCSREGFSLDQAREDTSKLLISLIKIEISDMEKGRGSSFNCCRVSLAGFARELGIAADEMPTGWQDLCRTDP